MTRARYEVLSHEQDFLVVGVTKGQVEAASAKAGERAKIEFDRKEKEDPLVQIEKKVTEAAETPDERFLAQFAVSRLEELRANWATLIGKERCRATLAGRPEPSLETIFKDTPDYAQPSLVGRRIYYKYEGPFSTLALGEYRVHFPILSPYIDLQGGKRTAPSQAFQERVLKGLGALRDNQSFDYLQVVPSHRPEYRGPYRDSFGVKHLPTTIPGAEADVILGIAGINIHLTTEAFSRAIGFPKA